jgi:hypothetical protein
VPEAQPSQAIGNPTKFGANTACSEACNVPASPAAHPLSQPDSTVSSDKSIDIAQDMGSNPQSCLIAGTPGSGKGMVVSNAVRRLKANHPKLTVMMIDPKADPKERGYWAGCVDVFRSVSLMDCPDPDEGASWLLACMDEFQRLEAPKLLIFDEMLAACTELGLADAKMKAPQRLKKFVSGIISQGDSQFSWIWSMTQSVTASDLGFSSGVRGNLRAIGIISPKNIAAIQGLVSTRLIPPPKGGLEELAQLMEKSPVDRAFFDGKSSRWYPMPELENHSGYDRDSRTYLEGELLQTKKQDANPRESLEKLFQETPALPTAPAIELIESVPNGEKREALLIAYRWAVTRLEDGKNIDKGSFVERARKERNCAYLRNNRDEIWDELQGLVD